VRSDALMRIPVEAPRTESLDSLNLRKRCAAARAINGRSYPTLSARYQIFVGDKRGVRLNVIRVSTELRAGKIVGPIGRARLDGVHRDVGVGAARFVCLGGEPGAEEHGLIEHAGIDDQQKHGETSEADAHERRDVIPPKNAAAAPFVGLHGEGVAALVGEAEDFLATVMVFLGDDPAHFVGAGVATVNHVLKRDAGRNVERTTEAAGLLGAEVKDFLGLLVAGDDAFAVMEAAKPTVIVEEVEFGGIDRGDIDAKAAVWVFEEDMKLLKLTSFAVGRLGDSMDETFTGIEMGF
jgi:hypothetical protein